MFRRWWTGSVAVLVSATAIGCGGESQTTPTVGAPVTATTEQVTTPTTPTTTTTEAGPTVLTAEVVAGEVRGGGRTQVGLGEKVRLRVSADVADEVHLHGYDISADVAPGSPANLDFTADIPGVFEVELEARGLAVMEIVVR